MTAVDRIAIYPGSFDPVTLGHEDIARRGLGLADRVIVAVAHTATQSKKSLFSVEDRLRIMEEVFADNEGIECMSFQGLLVDFARSVGATMVIRGLRIRVPDGPHESGAPSAAGDRVPHSPSGLHVPFVVPGS
jgi:pantetheine-phosphate adenylyltransferase